jgi:hypothetical protein
MPRGGQRNIALVAQATDVFGCTMTGFSGSRVRRHGLESKRVRPATFVDDAHEVVLSCDGVCGTVGCLKGTGPELQNPAVTTNLRTVTSRRQHGKELTPDRTGLVP